MLKVSKIKRSQKIIDYLIFCFKVCKHFKSNAIVIGKNKQTFGIPFEVQELIVDESTVTVTTNTTILKASIIFRHLKLL